MSEKKEGKLKKVIGFWDAMGIGIGQIIGSGIMILTGIAIDITGTGVPLAFIIACVVVIFPVTVLAFLGSAVPATGGMYTYVRDYIGKKTGFYFLVLLVAGQLVLAMFAITFAEYFCSLVPAINPTLVAFLILTICFLINIRGLGIAAKFQNVMVAVLLLALLLFIAFGVPKVDFTIFSEPNAIMPNGVIAFMTAISLLTFATGGAQFLSELGGEMKDPGKTMPRAMISSTALVGIFYAFIGVVAVGVLPVSEVAGQSLVKVANAVLPTPLFVFFVIGGGMFAVATTLNGSFTWCTKALLVASKEGWLPKGCSNISKWGTPWVLLTIFYIIGAVPILSGVSIRTIAMLGNGISLFFFIFPILTAFLIHKKNPEAMAKTPFPLKKPVLFTFAAIAIVCYGIAAALNISDITNSWILIVVITVAAIIYAHMREKYLNSKEESRLLYEE